MYLENDIVEFLRLPKETVEFLETNLETDYDDIEFFFIEYDKNDKGQEYAVLSAETKTKFAIVNCPVEYLDNTYQVESEKLITKMCIDWALDQLNQTSDEARKLELLEYLKELTSPKKEKPQSPGELKIGPIINEDDEYSDAVVNDDELFFMPEYEPTPEDED